MTKKYTVGEIEKEWWDNTLSKEDVLDAIRPPVEVEEYCKQQWRDNMIKNNLPGAELTAQSSADQSNNQLQ